MATIYFKKIIKLAKRFPIISLFSISFLVFLFDVFFSSKSISLEALCEASRIAIMRLSENGWVEIVCSIVIYWILEEKIRNISDIPIVADDDDYKKILDQFHKETISKITIVSETMEEFLNDEKDERKFKEAIEEALKKVKSIDILLQHPDTFVFEQREKSSSQAVKPIYDRLKKNIYFLSYLIGSVGNNKNKIKVKLYRTSARIVFTQWDSQAYFSLPGSDKKNYLVKTTTPLFETFEKYYKELNESASTMLIDDYLYLTIGELTSTTNTGLTDTTKIENLYWGANLNNEDLPRFITFSSGGNQLDYFGRNEKNLNIVIVHNKISNRGQIKKIDIENDRSKYDFAQKQIQKNYPYTNLDKVNNGIYEIGYFEEQNKIALRNKNEICKNLKKYSCIFVSYNQYDILLNKKIKDYLHSTSYCFDNCLDIDEYDKKQISTDSKKNEPRKRLLSIYDLYFNPTFVLERTCIDKYFKNSYSDEKERNFTTLDTKIAQSNGEIKSHLENLDKLINYVIEDDFRSINFDKEYCQPDSKFTIYVHLIRSEVKNENPTFTTEEYDNNNNYDYQVTHLIDRKNIFGGHESIEVECKGERATTSYPFLLENPMDTIFRRTKNVDGVYNIKKHKFDSIRFDSSITEKDSNNSGYRDVLVIEFKKQ
ncbi:2OG-Fe dioxygenase family protein [Runella sp. SP2]|uniref:2OG-Fe dioxygenase family protein n=1 Tax=Runella sp. SP2 TaxID=2268026 RepID=UPI000F082AAB|nr:2OG-Fe dioxygenase family protein [Runella sp. SP2]AYQ31187.1 hypothetical protein DTQ70_02895 [Runella sp. SP2]